MRQESKAPDALKGEYVPPHSHSRSRSLCSLDDGTDLACQRLMSKHSRAGRVVLALPTALQAVVYYITNEAALRAASDVSSLQNICNLDIWTCLGDITEHDLKNISFLVDDGFVPIEKFFEALRTFANKTKVELTQEVEATQLIESRAWPILQKVAQVNADGDWTEGASFLPADYGVPNRQRSRADTAPFSRNYGVCWRPVIHSQTRSMELPRTLPRISGIQDSAKYLAL
ncbi:hypothetical protein LTS08_001371 [Lithohypha guttulata]|nr:hypothetical protein LTS08_001371 [Lithohypha guttulata]